MIGLFLLCLLCSRTIYAYPPHQHTVRGAWLYTLTCKGRNPWTDMRMFGSSPYRFFMKHEDEEEPQPIWPMLRKLLQGIIEPSKGWEDATLIATREEMGLHFHESFPDVLYDFDSLHLALFDLNIAYERNEHNNKFYYLANWKS